MIYSNKNASSAFVLKTFFKEHTTFSKELAIGQWLTIVFVMFENKKCIVLWAPSVGVHIQMSDVLVAVAINQELSV